MAFFDSYFTSVVYLTLSPTLGQSLEMCKTNEIAIVMDKSLNSKCKSRLIPFASKFPY